MASSRSLLAFHMKSGGLDSLNFYQLKSRQVRKPHEKYLPKENGDRIPSLWLVVVSVESDAVMDPCFIQGAIDN